MEQIRIAIQKSGRLSEQSLELLRESGISIANGERRLISAASGFPLEVLYLRDDDIPQYVADNVADIGIVGENVIMEKASPVLTVLRLGFGKCRLSLAIPRNEEYASLNYFNGKKIATSYPGILRKFLHEKGINAEIHEISGSVEIAPGIGLAHGIFDIVSSGSTLISNGLKEVETVTRSEAILIANQNLDPAAKILLDKLVFRFKSVQAAKSNKYILLNAPDKNLEEIIRIIPGMKSPTVMALAEPGWSSVHSVLKENEFWDIIDKLKDLGAQGILVIPIEKMII